MNAIFVSADMTFGRAYRVWAAPNLHELNEAERALLPGGRYLQGKVHVLSRGISTSSPTR